MLYKQAWQEFKEYIEHELPLLAGQEPVREKLLTAMRYIEERWKITPEKVGRGG